MAVEATPSKLQPNRPLVKDQVATAASSTAAFEAASEDEAVASEEVSEVIEVGLEEGSEATEVDMADEVESATRAVIVAASAADRPPVHLAVLEVHEVAMMTREMDMVVGMAEAVTVVQQAATEILLVLAAVEIDMTTETGMEAVDEMTTTALESDTTTEIPTTIRDQSDDTRHTRDETGLWLGTKQTSPIVLMLQLSIVVCWWVWYPLPCINCSTVQGL